MAASVISHALAEAHDECVKLNVPSHLLSALMAVHDAKDFIEAYRHVTETFTAFVMAEPNLERSEQVYDILLTLFHRTSHAFEKLYPGNLFYKEGPLFFE